MCSTRSTMRKSARASRRSARPARSAPREVGGERPPRAHRQLRHRGRLQGAERGRGAHQRLQGDAEEDGRGPRRGLRGRPAQGVHRVADRGRRAAQGHGGPAGRRDRRAPGDAARRRRGWRERRRAHHGLALPEQEHGGGREGLGRQRGALPGAGDLAQGAGRLDARRRRRPRRPGRPPGRDAGCREEDGDRDEAPRPQRRGAHSDAQPRRRGLRRGQGQDGGARRGHEQGVRRTSPRGRSGQRATRVLDEVAPRTHRHRAHPRLLRARRVVHPPGLRRPAVHEGDERRHDRARVLRRRRGHQGRAERPGAREGVRSAEAERTGDRRRAGPLRAAASPGRRALRALRRPVDAATRRPKRHRRHARQALRNRHRERVRDGPERDPRGDARHLADDRQGHFRDDRPAVQAGRGCHRRARRRRPRRVRTRHRREGGGRRVLHGGPLRDGRQPREGLEPRRGGRRRGGLTRARRSHAQPGRPSTEARA